MAAKNIPWESKNKITNNSDEDLVESDYSEEFKLMKSLTDFHNHQTEPTLQNLHHMEQYTHSRLCNPSLFKATNKHNSSRQNTLDDHIVRNNILRRPGYSLSLPRKNPSCGIISNGDNLSEHYPTYCNPKVILPAATEQFHFHDSSREGLSIIPSKINKNNETSSIKLSVKDLTKRFQKDEIQRDNSSIIANMNHTQIECDIMHKSINETTRTQVKKSVVSSSAQSNISNIGSVFIKEHRNNTQIYADFIKYNSMQSHLIKSPSAELKQNTNNNEFIEQQKPVFPTKPVKQRQIQLQLKQNPEIRQLFAIIQEEVFQSKTSHTYNINGDLLGSYTSLECPSPPGPPTATSGAQKGPQIHLGNYLRKFYQELAFEEQIQPVWSLQSASDALCPARFEPELRLNTNSHGISDYLTVDELLVSIKTKDGSFLEAPRRCLVECPSWSSRKNLGVRILHAWAKGHLWPNKGIPIALTIFIPLLELKRSFAHFIEKEILPKGSLNPLNNTSGGFCAAWSSLKALGPKLLIILDGYTNQKISNISGNYFSSPRKLRGNSNGGNNLLNSVSLKSQFPTDVYDLLDGKLFPEARILILTNCLNCAELMPIIQRHVMFKGLTWGRSASILEGGHWGGTSRLINFVHESASLRQTIRTPLGCLAIAAIYDNLNGHLPTEELDVLEAVFNCVAPQVLNSNVSELGRLALFCLKTKRKYITMSEMKMYCSTTDIIIGCLEQQPSYGKTARKKGNCIFYPMCQGMFEYLAANYIVSIASRPGLLTAEITGMAISDELDVDLLKVLKFSMSLLGDQAHILLSKLTPLWLSPHTVFTLALAGEHTEDNMTALCDVLGISKHPPISPLETKPLWVQVRSVAIDLMGWGMALKSTSCTLKNFELIYQLEKQNLLETRKAIDIFLESITENESVVTLRLSSLIEMDVQDSEINYLANCISKLLLKPRLENFELVLTLIEEDPPMLKLQSVVTALCRCLPHQDKLNSLLLDIGLCTSQLVQICAALEDCPNLVTLSLPHLRCEKEAVTTLASLVNSRSVSFLFLPSCWGARDDPPSSSGISMGSGSGSSTGTSGIIKQGSLPGVPSPKSYAPGIFSSLPRGIFAPQISLGRSATLPRQLLDQRMEKRSCESVVSKAWYPMPSCDGISHNSGTLHDLFVIMRDKDSKLHGLDLSKAHLSLEDSMCLGETVRISNTLNTLKLEGLSRISDILPSILGASESSSLQMLNIGSQKLSLDDTIIVMCARALTSCHNLLLLSIDGWCLRVEHTQTLSILLAFFSLTSIRELNLSNCRLHTSLIKPNSKIVQIYENRSVVVLKLPGAQIILPDTTVISGPKLLQFINGFSCLRELDLSSPAKSSIENTHTMPLILDDKAVINFFQNLHSNFGLLNTLKMCNWIIHFHDMSKSIKTIGKVLRNSLISHLKIDGISVLERLKNRRCEVNLIQCFVSTLSHLRWIGISLAGKKEDQITALGSTITNLKGSEIDIRLSKSTIDQAKLIAQVISLDGKFDIKVSTFGTSSGILIHAEKCGVKSLNRKNKE